MKIFNRVLASTLSLMISFIVSYLFMQALIYWIAVGLDYECKFTYNEVFVPTDYRLWTRIGVVEVDFIPAFICAIISLLIFRSLTSQEKSWGRYQIVAFWFMICFGNLFLSQLIFSPLGIADHLSTFYYTLARVLAWFHIPSVIAGGFAFVALLTSAVAGYYVCIEAVKLSHSYRLTEKRAGKNQVILLYYVLPILLAFLPLVFLAKEYTSMRMAFMLICLIFPAAGMLVRTSVGPFQVRYQKTVLADNFPVIELIVAVIIWAGIYFFAK